MQYHLQIHRLIKSACTNTLTFSALVLTSSVCISQLLTDHSCINTAPTVITHCPPLVINAHLHSTLILIGASHHTNISISTVSSCIDCTWNFKCCELICSYWCTYGLTYFGTSFPHHQCESSHWYLCCRDSSTVLSLYHYNSLNSETLIQYQHQSEHC